MNTIKMWAKNLFLLFIMIMVSTPVQGEWILSETQKVYILLGTQKYYEMNDLKEAARVLRDDAKEQGADVYLVPHYAKRFYENQESEDEIEFFLNYFTISLKKMDLSFFSQIVEHGRQDEFISAVVLTKRALSIDETASLFEGGIRILKRISGGFVVRGKGIDLKNSFNNEYFYWAGEVLPEYRIDNKVGESPLGRYSLKYYNPYNTQYTADLESLGIVVEGRYEGYGTFSIMCSWEEAQKVSHLWWVQCIQAAFGTASD